MIKFYDEDGTLCEFEAEMVIRAMAFKRDHVTIDQICLTIVVEGHPFPHTVGEFLRNTLEPLGWVLTIWLRGWDDTWFSKVMKPAFAENRTVIYERGADAEESPFRPAALQRYRESLPRLVWSLLTALTEIKALLGKRLVSRQVKEEALRDAFSGIQLICRAVEMAELGPSLSLVEREGIAVLHELRECEASEALERVMTSADWPRLEARCRSAIAALGSVG